MGGGSSTISDVPYEDGNPTRSSFQNAQNLTIVTYHWPAKIPTVASVVAAHGLQSHTRFEWAKHPGVVYFGSWIEMFNEKGVDFWGYDHQGHGLSQGWANSRCNVRCFDDYVTDMLQMFDLVADTQNVPIFLLGESMGGAMVVRALSRRCAQEGNKPSGGIMTAPMLSIDNIKAKPMNRVLLPFASFLSMTMPHLPISDIEKNTMFPYIQEEIDNDPLTVVAKVPARLAAECINVVDKAISESKLIDVPLLVCHSTKDTQCEIIGSERLIEHATSCSDKTLHRVEDMWHCLSQEPNNEKVHEVVCKWIMQRIK